MNNIFKWRAEIWLVMLRKNNLLVEKFGPFWGRIQRGFERVKDNSDIGQKSPYCRHDLDLKVNYSLDNVDYEEYLKTIQGAIEDSHQETVKTRETYTKAIAETAQETIDTIKPILTGLFCSLPTKPYITDIMLTQDQAVEWGYTSDQAKDILVKPNGRSSIMERNGIEGMIIEDEAVSYRVVLGREGLFRFGYHGTSNFENNGSNLRYDFKTKEEHAVDYVKYSDTALLQLFRLGKSVD
ncbi:hypothetical protein CL622_00620 [archaeon]|nr:hypothetical protein [archaeon]|tara:strand:- start:2406 stop:3122 length:717 start_codon:yes stop_codon:yes gene_type:complete